MLFEQPHLLAMNVWGEGKFQSLALRKTLVFQEPDANHFARVAHIATAAGARTSLFVPEQARLYLAVPHRGRQKAEVRIYEAR